MKSSLPALAIILLALSAAVFLAMCSRKSARQQQSAPTETQMSAMVGPPVIVYKTRADYSQHIPIILTPDKKEIVSYPAPGDVYYQGELAYPLPLGNDYLLDRRGIDENVVFIALTYEAYSQLERAPRPAELLDMIIDKDPIVEMYHCGVAYQYKDLVSELSTMAHQNNWTNCRRLK